MVSGENSTLWGSFERNHWHESHSCISILMQTVLPGEEQTGGRRLDEGAQMQGAGGKKQPVRMKMRMMRKRTTRPGDAGEGM